ncbi:hypothetical protein [Ponticaulis sp.]|uniref:hypothetical protein n=1 Tax=Ponticaulis sp. TaxID=2020902 RepID=UPI000C6AC6B3|nr:hypothetical protein [Ponticaulis sp.]MAJ10091.1 hypothetical protein [Ponticaulis sp.]HBJ93108.1 hypothetical protein [Hyphomonadaceae bacterium]
MEKFSFSSALMHFRISQGPSGFVWKWLLAYVLVFGLANAIVSGLQLYSYYQALDAVAEGEFRATQPFTNLWRQILPLPFFVAILAMFEASALRWYIRREGFSLRFGKDEFRLLGVFLCWGGILILLSVAGGLFLMIFGNTIISNMSRSVAANLIITSLLALPFISLAIYVAISFMTSSALTIRENKVLFISSKRIVSGKFWRLLAAALVVTLPFYALDVIVDFFVVPLFLQLANAPPQDWALYDPTNSFQTFLITTVFTVGVVVLTAPILQLIMLGITSKAVLTDPDWVGQTYTVAETFE